MRRPALILILAGIASHASAAVFSVGPGGSHADLPSAWQALVTAGPGTHELRLATGDHAATQALALAIQEGTQVEISGSWNAGFTTFSGDRSATRIIGASSDRLLQLSMTGGQFVLANLSLSLGASDSGGLVNAAINGDANVQFRNLDLSNGVGIGYAGCMHLTARGQSTVTLDQIAFSQCRVELWDSFRAEHGSAMILRAHQSARVRIQALQVRDNLTRVDVFPGPGGIGGSAVELTADDVSRVLMADFEFIGNRVIRTGTEVAVTAGLVAASPWEQLTGNAVIEIRRGRILDNLCEACSDSRQLTFAHSSNAQLRGGDLLVANGKSGVQVLTDDMASLPIALTNLSVTRHSNRGLAILRLGFPSPPLPMLAKLSNSVLHANGTDLETNGQLLTTNNLIGTDPLFANPAAGDFRPGLLSPLIDAGTALAVPLGDRDLDGMPRIQGPLVDIGAYEHRAGGALAGSGFE